QDGERARQADEEADRAGRRLRAEAAPDRLPRADAGLLLRHLVHVHRPHLQALRAPQHRGRRGGRRLRVPEALGGVHPLREPAGDRPRRHALLRPERGDGEGAAGLGHDQRRPHGRDRLGRRLDRVALGAADRAVRPRGGADAPGGASLTRTSAARLSLPAAVVFLAAAVFVGALVGPVHLGAANVVRAVFAHVLGLRSPLHGANDAILWDLRLPRVVLGALVGGTLAAAGAAYQGVFRNPLADPYLLGAAAGAGLGATIVVAYGPSGSISRDLLPLAAFAGAALAVVVAYVLGRTAAPAGRAAALVLAGVTVASFLTALQTFVPHTIRLLVGGSYRLLLPLSVLVGAGFLVFADVIARTIMSPAELPIGVVTAFFGAPFFAVVLRTSRRAA